MKKQETNSLGTKIAYGVGIAGVAVALVAGTSLLNVKQDNKAMANTLAIKSASVASLNSQLDASKISNEEYVAKISELGVNVTDLTVASDADQKVIDDYATEVALLNEELEKVVISIEVETNGYSVDKEITAFDIETLNDNQFEKLGDYEVDFDGDSVDVEEFLSVKGNFNVEGETSLMFNKGEVAYSVEFDSTLDYTDDSLEISILGEAYNIVDITGNILYLESVNKEFVGVGAEIEGITVLRISENAIILTDGVDTEVMNKGDTVEFGDISVELESIFYEDGEGDLAVLRIGEDLDKTVEVGDFVDEAEMWEFTTIQKGKIVISLAEDVEEVSELVLPNDFAKISFELSSEDYNSVEVTKKNDVMDEVVANFEEFDATRVEWNGTAWVMDDDNGDEFVVNTSLELKDSSYIVDFINSTDVIVAGINVSVSDIAVNGDEDETYTTSEGIVVDERDSWNENDDESIVIEVPEKAVEATILVE